MASSCLSKTPAGKEALKRKTHRRRVTPSEDCWRGSQLRVENLKTLNLILGTTLATPRSANVPTAERRTTKTRLGNWYEMLTMSLNAALRLDSVQELRQSRSPLAVRRIAISKTLSALEVRRLLPNREEPAAQIHQHLREGGQQEEEEVGDRPIQLRLQSERAG